MDFNYNDIYIKGRRLLQGGRFSLPEQGLFLITGENGSGKTLLLNQLFRRQLDAGRDCVLIDQSNDRLLPHCSVMDNIAFSYGDYAPEAVEGYLSDKGFAHLLAHAPTAMSGGEKRMVCLLRGLYAQPRDVLFIDEPTNDLDVQVVSKFLKLLKESSERLLILAVSHDDRILRLADGFLRLENGVLHSETLTVSAPPEQELDAPAAGNSQKTANAGQRALMRRHFSFNWSSLLLYIVFAVLTVLAGHTVVNAYNEQLPPMRGDQIDLYLPVSSYGESLKMKQASLPIKFVSFLNGESSISEFVAAFDEDRSAYRHVNFELALPESENYTCYYLEYYDISAHQSFFTAEKYFELSGETALNPKGLFDFSFAIHNDLSGEAALQEAEFAAAAAYFEDGEGQGLSPVFCTVVLKPGYSLLDFYQSEALKPLLDMNCYIRSNDTISLLNDASLFHAQKETLMLMQACAVLLLLMELVSIYLYMRLGKRKIRIFCNMAVPLSCIRRSISEGMRERLLRRSAIGCMAAVCTFYAISAAQRDESLCFLFWAYYIEYAFILLLAGLLIKIVCKKNLLRYADWRFR